MMSWSHALVTGGAGFIGSHLTRALLGEGRRVTVLDNLSVGRREVVPGEARFVHGDVRDEAAIADALAGVDCVFHLAAQVTIRGSFDRFHEDLDTNVMGTARLLKAVDPRRSGFTGLVDGVTRTLILRGRSTGNQAPLSPWRRQARRGRRLSPDSRGAAFPSLRLLFQYLRADELYAYVGVPISSRACSAANRVRFW